MKVGYVGVCSVEENEGGEVEGLKGDKIEGWLIEKVCGKNMDRGELEKMVK